MTHLSLRFAPFALLIAIFGAVIATPTGTLAAPNAEAALHVTGVVEGEGVFAGAISDLSFAVDLNGELAVSGQLEGTVELEGEEPIVIDQRFDATVAVLQGSGCDALHLDVGPIVLDVNGHELLLAEVVVDVRGSGGGGLLGLGNLLNDLTCSVNDLIDVEGAEARLAKLLNRIVNELD